MDTRHPTIMEALAEGAHARAIGLPKDSCPYHANMPERQAWLDGYDGSPSDDGPDTPMADARGTTTSRKLSLGVAQQNSAQLRKAD
jgi:ribosome modulation factor